MYTVKSSLSAFCRCYLHHSQEEAKPATKPKEAAKPKEVSVCSRGWPESVMVSNRHTDIRYTDILMLVLNK